ncbi:MAG: 2-phosphosulfolactate phosphatase, partial [Bacteroidota bacterium]
FEFQNPLLKDKNIAFTTTNGTKSIKLSKQWGAAQVAIGSFLNIDVLCKWLAEQPNDVALLCSGWKDLPNLEDTLFAGAVAEKLKHVFDSACDSTLMARSLYQGMKTDLEQHVRTSSHAQRFNTLHTGQDDVKFCLQFNAAPVLPVMQGEYIVNAHTAQTIS